MQNLRAICQAATLSGLLPERAKEMKSLSSGLRKSAGAETMSVVATERAWPKPSCMKRQAAVSATKADVPAPVSTIRVALLIWLAAANRSMSAFRVSMIRKVSIHILG